MLKSRDSFPIGGWIFHQPQTGWSSNPHNGFNDTVNQIIAHRNANRRFNLPVDRATVEKELEVFTELRMRSIPGGEAFLIANSPPPNGSFPFPPLPRRVAGEPDAPSVVATRGEGAKVKAGVSVIAEWLGKGLKPASVELATKRAETCSKCPLNKPATGLDIITGAAAKAVGVLMQAKSDLKLVTPYDEKLEACSACSCVNRLKIWSPIDIVWKHTTPEVFEALHDACWIRSEPRT